MLLKKNKKTVAKQPKQKKVTAKQASYDFVNATKDFENSRVADIEASKNIAWRIAVGACVLATAAVVAVMMLTPLKEVRPYVIRVDNNTGETDIVTMLENSKSDYGEEVAKYFCAMYVDLMESYDWYTIQNQIDKAMLFSDSNMQNRISTKYAQPSAPHKTYKDDSRIEIVINNTSIISDNNLIQVRFTKKLVPTNGGSYDAQQNKITPSPEISHHIATIGYDYVNVPTLDDVRLVNPLGFTVKTYKVTGEMGVK